jgi:ABC-type multidrug transport system fused ATPase/permease subunit
MKTIFPLSEVYRLLEPGPVVLLTTTRAGRPNVMPMSWHLMMEFTPPLVGCVVSNGNYWGVHPIVCGNQKGHFQKWIMRDVVLEIKNLTRRFGAFTAVDALTLSVNAGEVFGLLGSNGAGKTTTIKMLTTLLPPTSGEARVAGFSITNQPVGVRRAIGYVPQAVSVDGSLTGYENLLIFAKLYDLPATASSRRALRRPWSS